MHPMISEPSNPEGNGRGRQKRIVVLTGRQKRIVVLALVGILVSSIVIAALLFHPGRHTVYRTGPGNSTLISPSSPGDRSDPAKGSITPSGRAVEESSPADGEGKGDLSG